MSKLCSFLRDVALHTYGQRRAPKIGPLYGIEIDEPELDRRLAIAQSVSLDALQSR